MKFRNTLTILLLFVATAGAVVVGRMALKQILTAEDSGTLQPESGLMEDAEVLEFCDSVEISRPSYWDPNLTEIQLEQSAPLGSQPVRQDVVEQYACLPNFADEQQPVASGSSPANQKTTSQPPGALPQSNNAVAIPTTDVDEIREVIRQAMPDANQAERDIWQQQMEGMSPDEMRFLLSQRQQLAMPFSDTSKWSIGDLSTTGTSETVVPEKPQVASKPSLARANTPDAEAATAVIRMNLSNQHTIGYRQRELLFSPRRNVDGVSFTVRLEHSTGEMTQTHRQLDLAIEGTGFLRLTDRDGGEFYCRSAPFVLTDGKVVLDEGDSDNPLVLVEGIPGNAKNFSIDEKGSVRVTTADEETHTVGKVKLATFFDATQLEPVGQSLFRETKRSGKAFDVGSSESSKVLQGMLEGSNVEVDAQHRQLEKLGVTTR